MNAMKAAGLRYTGIGDTAQCDVCNVEISGWTMTMIPFIIHAERSPNCSFVRSMQPSSSITTISSCQSITVYRAENTVQSNNNENPPKRQKIETFSEPNTLNLTEIKTLKQIRRRSFSNWPRHALPSRDQMIEAGFFNCNVGDRVICIYCNLICQQWTPHSDDPCEIHRTLRPQCPFVISMLIHHRTRPILIVNELTNDDSSVGAGTIALNGFHSNEIVLTSAYHNGYIEIPKRLASFVTWHTDSLPSVDDLARAGFFYTGTNTVVTCFYCNGSLQNWGPNDNATIEHARWFPHCGYAKQLCGDVLHRKIQESKRIQQERSRANESKERNDVAGINNSHSSINDFKLYIPDENTLSRLVAARLDLPISQLLLNQNFKLSIIKRCWEDQLRLKRM
ncbi:unnamed protein product [Rotaria sp. Silwood1]|nr:unnamed protein product [Rotaria sp. Silwood1]